MRSNKVGSIIEGLYDINESTKPSMSKLKKLTPRAIESDKGGKSGEWSIQRGGYDKWYEVYCNNEPVFAVVDGEVELYQNDFKEYAKEFSKVSGYPLKESVKEEKDFLSDFKKGDRLKVLGSKCDYEVKRAGKKYKLEAINPSDRDAIEMEYFKPTTVRVFLSQKGDYVIESKEIMELIESGMKDRVKAWYKETYPDDDLGDSIKGTVTFNKVYNALTNGLDFYKVTGAGDSLVRERIFQELAIRSRMHYDTIYDLWMYGGWSGLDRHKMSMDGVNNSIY